MTPLDNYKPLGPLEATTLDMYRELKKNGVLFHPPVSIVNPMLITQRFKPGLHEALDFDNYDDPNEKAMPVRAMEESVIYNAGVGVAHGENYLLLKGVESKNYYLYSHNPLDKNLKVGDRVYPGQMLGISDSSGTSSGIHLHFEIWIGFTLEPRRKKVRINPLAVFDILELDWRFKYGQ